MKPVQQISARLLPEARAELVQWLADDGPNGGPAVWSRLLEPGPAAQERRAAADWSVALRTAELFFVSKDMTRMAVGAGMALPSYRLDPEDLPAPHGLLLWEEYAADPYDSAALAGCPLIGVSWAQHGSGVHIRSWALREDWLAEMAKADPKAGLAQMSAAEVRGLRLARPQQLVCMSSGFMPFMKVPGWLSTMPEDTSRMTLAELEQTVRHAGQQEQVERALIVTWLLMGQTLAREEEVPPSRAAVKHLRRIDPALLGSVRYVQLRHARNLEQADRSEGGGQSYRHTWIVRGHWRNHWYPSRNAHRPIWIDSHVKGPDGASLLDPGKLVNVLRR